VKYIFIYIAVIYANVVYGQLSDLRQYYENVNKAELAIVYSDYSNASKYYKEAFKYAKYEFSQDLYNAALVSIVTKSYSQALNYLDKLYPLGFKLNTLDTVMICKEFLASSYGKEARQRSKNVKLIYNVKYKRAIDKMLNEDQYFRIKPDGYKNFGDTINAIDNRNVKNFLKLIAKYGFPSEAKIGVDPVNIVVPKFFVLIFHQNNGARYQTYNYSAILKSAVLKGELRNNIGASLIQGAEGVRHYDAFGIAMAKFDTTITVTDTMGNIIKKDTTLESGWGYFKLSAPELESYDRKRREIYLESMEDNIKKIIFCIKPNYFLFNVNSNKSIFKYGTYKDFLNAKNNLIYP